MVGRHLRHRTNAMRTFFRDHWKAIAVIAVLILLAMFTVTPGAAAPAPSLAERLRAHVAVLAPGVHDTVGPAERERAARYIAATLANDGYAVRREYAAGARTVRNIEVSIARVAPHARPARIFIVGVHYGASAVHPVDQAGGSGAAAVLELARLLEGMRPRLGTEIRFVFFANGTPPRRPGSDAPAAPGDFIAFAGTGSSSRLVQQALSAFQAAPDVPARGLAAPDYVQGLTLSGHAPGRRFGYPAIVVTDTAFGRYPCYQATGERSEDAPEQPDFAGLARVVGGLARTLAALAGAQQD